MDEKNYIYMILINRISIKIMGECFFNDFFLWIFFFIILIN
jgi:hypothetical protein